jgi:hypothetical protein
MVMGEATAVPHAFTISECDLLELQLIGEDRKDEQCMNSCEDCFKQQNAAPRA